jgi:hypothetical protein
VRFHVPASRRLGLCALLLFTFLPHDSASQSAEASERAFSQSKNSIEQMLKRLQPAMGGRLPVLEGFVASSDRSLDRYRRAHFQSTVQVSANPSGGSVVRVTTKITAWYVDPEASHSGYRVLTSNGRLESDLLDQLSDELAGKDITLPTSSAAASKETAPPAAEPPSSAQTEKAVAVPSGPFAPARRSSLPAREQAAAEPKDPDVDTKIKSLEEILRNQGHPNNLVAVKQSGTAVVAAPSLTAKTLFLASAHDEFEMLDFNADWVHVRISGLSRGWIWRNSLEMPDGIPDTTTRSAVGGKAAAEQLFHVSREETATFPGDWEPLRGKNVKIVSIEKTDSKASDAGVTMRLEFAKSVLDKNYAELSQTADRVAGVVLIFDSADGGMIAATLPAMQQWRAGTLSDSAFWHQCFFDPPELLSGAGTSASQ